MIPDMDQWPGENREAFDLGRATDDLLANPYQDNSLLARLYVDGWASRYTDPACLPRFQKIGGIWRDTHWICQIDQSGQSTQKGQNNA